MSYFIANSLTISKDFKQFKIKGGDNNVVPRCNYWSDWIDIEHLLGMLSSGSLQFGNSHKEKFLMLSEIAFEYKKKYGGDWDKCTDMYHAFNKDPMPKKLINLNQRFINRIKKEYKGITKKEHYVLLTGIGHNYVSIVHWSEVKPSRVWYGSWHSAKKFGKHQAKEIARRWGGEVVTKLIKD